MKNKKYYIILLFTAFFYISYSQDISLYKQFNGRYDFTFIGNTLNLVENGTVHECTVLTSSSAELTLNPQDEIENAYLYWAGSGTGDLDIKLNNHNITAQRTFPLYNQDTGLNYFSAFADVTQQVQQTGSAIYTVSDLDVSAIITGNRDNNPYCNNGTNFAGWAIIIILKNENLPLNQLNIYDGMQHVPNEINITLSSLNVIDNNNAKIGFLAWEGDREIAVNETLRLNNVILQNTLNPPTNAFNGTNSVTGSITLYNMDLDIYDVQDIIQIGDETAHIQLTSGQDFVMVNAIITKFNSQLPDATITIEDTFINCNSRTVKVNYTAKNINSTDILPAPTPIAIYANGILLQTTQTQNNIPIGGSESNSITIAIPETIPDIFTLKFVIDDTGNGTGIIIETDETNNSYEINIQLNVSPELKKPENIVSCNIGFGRAVFDFSHYENELKNNPGDTVKFFNTEEDAEQNNNPIYNTGNYTSDITPQQIFVRLDDQETGCFAISSFMLVVKNCPPTTYNYVTPNNDGDNDTFYIDGLRNIFLNFELSIYNRWGNLIWTGNHSKEDWDAIATNKIGPDNQTVPNGTYYFVLKLNDPDYPEPIVGWVYVTR